MRKIKQRFMVAIAALALVFSSLTCNVGAKENKDVRLQISPPTQEIELNPGDEYSGSYQVQNTGDSEFRFKVSVAPYSVINENYDPDYDTIGNYNQIVNWITLGMTEGVVEANTTVDVPYTISVPQDVPAGGQHAVILNELVPDEDSGSNEKGTTITNVSRVGVIVYAKVNGDTREEGELVQDSINAFSFGSPIQTSSIVKNTGNTAFKASYTMTVHSIFAKDTDDPLYSNEEKPDERIILPETQRLNVLVWNEAPKVGIFKVSQIVNILGKPYTKEGIVIACPIWLLLVILTFIILCIIWIVTRINGRKSSKK